MMTHVEINQLEMQKQEILRIFKKQLDDFRSLKKEIEKVEWADAKYDALVTSMNEIARAIAQGIETITNGYDTYVIDELLPLVKDYVSVARDFPKI